MEPLPEGLGRDRRPQKPFRRMHVVGVILVATVCVAIGETLLSAGMKRVNAAHPSGAGILLAAVSDWRVLLGTALMALYFGLYSLALSWADISFVLPFTALSYVLVAAFARFFLHEHVTPTRWVGALIIVLGVIVVGLGERHR